MSSANITTRDRLHAQLPCSDPAVAWAVPIGDARRLIQRARTAGLLDRVRIGMGLPLEFYLQAVHPLIEAYASHLHTLRCHISNGAVQPDGVFMRSLELACFALDFRRGRILPPSAAPEDIGERAPRWTYAVFVAALLYRAPAFGSCTVRGGLLPAQMVAGDLNESLGGATGSSGVPPANPLLLFRYMVPPAIQAWLATDNALLGELHAFLLGEGVTRNGTIAELIRQAAGEVVSDQAVGAASSQPHCNDVRSPANQSGECKDVSEGNAVTLLRQDAEAKAANCFMNWIAGGIRDGSIRINDAGAPVHFVQEGMLLVSPRIFRDFARRHGEDGNGAAQAGKPDESSLGKGIQRQVLRRGWHGRAGNGSNIQHYDVMRKGRPVSGLCGVLITQPERFVSPVPAANPLLLRRRPA